MLNVHIRVTLLIRNYRLRKQNNTLSLAGVIYACDYENKCFVSLLCSNKTELFTEFYK